MFVTAFMGYLDIPTGKFTCVNAGHNPPLLGRDGGFEWIKIKHGLVLGGMEDMFYKEETMTIKPGDMVYLYTDGVTEALNPEEELFGESRLMEAANKCGDSGLKDFIFSIKKDIDAFVRGAEQADDITMLVMQYKGTGK
jgi:sigma-B regulation protein RsbU (phosphoserine phosphatase)